jgi:HEAT repeat protein
MIRRILGTILVVAGLSTTWAWGQVARLAGPAPAAAETPGMALYAAWQLDDAEQVSLFRSTDEGTTWQSLPLPVEAEPIAWADNNKDHVAVVTDDGSLLLSEDQGDSWIIVESGLDILSLTWGEDDHLYLGTDGQGVYQLSTGGALVASSMMQGELALERIVGLSLVEGRLFAAGANVVLYTDNTTDLVSGAAWTRSATLPDLVTAIVATDKQTVYAGMATTGVYKSKDAGQAWQPAWNGLGLAAGQMVRVTALTSDPQEPGLLYAAVDHIVGSTQVHASAAGTFVTLDHGAFWQPLAGPAFPEAQHAMHLVLVPGRPLYAQAVTAGGLQAYAPDVMRILAALESDDPKARASAARQLGLVRPLGVWSELLAALDDPDPSVSLIAADALGRINDPAAVPGLLIAVEHPSGPVRLGAARALGMMQVEAAVEPLRAMLLRGEGSEVSVAGEALGHIGGPAATEALLTVLADPQPTARWHAAMAALERIGEPAVAPLMAILDSQDSHARRSAAQVLGWIGSSSSTEALVHTLREDGDATVRGQAAWALGEIGDPVAREALDRAQRRDPSMEVQTAAEWALSRVPVQSEGASSWAARWAPAFSRLQPVRWLVLALSLVGASWLVMGNNSLLTVPVRFRFRQR